jgi:hypothetical protein
VGLERGPLSLVSTIEELLGRKSSGSYLENREYGRRNPSRRPRGTIYPPKLTLTPPKRGCRYGTCATEFVCFPGVCAAPRQRQSRNFAATNQEKQLPIIFRSVTLSQSLGADAIVLPL